MGLVAALVFRVVIWSGACCCISVGWFWGSARCYCNLVVLVATLGFAVVLAAARLQSLEMVLAAALVKSMECAVMCRFGCSVLELWCMRLQFSGMVVEWCLLLMQFGGASCYIGLGFAVTLLILGLISDSWHSLCVYRPWLAAAFALLKFGCLFADQEDLTCCLWDNSTRMSAICVVSCWWYVVVSVLAWFVALG
ncbi:hypothetical protein U1Q18_015164, partial [Sarracenia purpurea var. burkii]